MLVVWVPVCLAAFWWQVTRAFGGNSLSYLYSVEWPVFAVIGVVGWWLLLHTDPETAGTEGLRRATAARADRPGGDGLAAHPLRRTEDEDEALAAYNDRLAALSQSGVEKTWRRR